MQDPDEPSGQDHDEQTISDNPRERIGPDSRLLRFQHPGKRQIVDFDHTQLLDIGFRRRQGHVSGFGGLDDAADVSNTTQVLRAALTEDLARDFQDVVDM